MAKLYLEKLSSLIEKNDMQSGVSIQVEVKHFFSGAALYVNNVICASWSPVGLAFKLPEMEVEKLLRKGMAKELRYFPKGHVKKGYALFENPEDKTPSYWKKYFVKAAKQVQC